MKRFLLFSLGDDIFAINVNDAVEVLRRRAVSRVPELPDFVSGVVDVRGVMVPVIDMRQRVGLPKAKANAKSRLLTVRSSLGRIALMVDGVKGIEVLDPESMSKPPLVFRGIKKRYLEALYNAGGMMYMILNVEEILTSEEKIILERAYHAMEDTGA